MTQTDCYVLGTSLQAFGKYVDTSVAKIGGAAVNEIVAENPDVPIDEVWCGSAISGMLIGQRVMREVGANGIPIFNIENACSSSASAFSLAVQRVQSGACRTALVVGVEKLSALGGGPLPLVSDDWEVQQNLSMPAVYAMRAMRYLNDTGCEIDDLVAVSTKNHNNAADNPRAYWDRHVTSDEVADSRMVADPLTLLQCCPTVDGAAAVLVGSVEFLDVSAPRIKVLSSVVQSGRFTNGYRDMTCSELSDRTAQLAYGVAGISASDVDIAEVHDAFSIAEIIYYESLGFARPGQGAEFIRDGVTQRDGTLPVNASGGLLGRGHPIGATGTAQIVEVALQLSERAGSTQVLSPVEVGLTHCTGGGIWGFDHGACAVSILGRVA